MNMWNKYANDDYDSPQNPSTPSKQNPAILTKIADRQLKIDLALANNPCQTLK